MTVTNLLIALRSVAIVLGIWWIVVVVANIPAYLLPTPDVVAQRFVFLAQTAELTEHIRVTLIEISVGFILGSVLGIAFG